MFEAIDHVATLQVSEDAPAEEDEHADEEGEGEEAHEGVDPHFFNDPARMATAAEALSGFLADEVPALDTAAFRDRAAAYVAELRALDAEVEATLAVVPPERRKLVTNHDVFAYFADRYGFEVVGAVIPCDHHAGLGQRGRHRRPGGHDRRRGGARHLRRHVVARGPRRHPGQRGRGRHRRGRAVQRVAR